MEVNKDEAERCREIAMKCLREGRFDKAVRFADKSLRLFPLPGVEELKARAEAALASGGADDA
eukprot:CAMPEP_0198431528 /NCGR_PEP_ID=MMETSP1452-20131203/19320_1 /TAXON_ID=1181717 /ORGANISM="Synchroma pusillum, Strain CCMP3072" /LENGTH=62 /DNA_ID=CAMNT_0044151987 /DNA_START=17 /DNA_END=202 /DNA_ORIENTATION=+